ncbi:MAG: hypothetical protein J7K23_00935 [Thermoproteales archaeon]|nr:hypothetical protein [Thermoproteales archaeon]
MTTYKGARTPWRGHRIIVNLVIGKINENVQKDEAWKKAYQELQAWQPISPVDDEAWLNFYHMLEIRAKKLKEKIKVTA